MSERVLYLLNISNPDRLTADSGWIFADLLAPALADAGADVTVAAPAPAGDGRAGFQRTAVPGTGYRARFAADLDQLVMLIRRTCPMWLSPTRSRLLRPAGVGRRLFKEYL